MIAEVKVHKKGQLIIKRIYKNKEDDENLQSVVDLVTMYIYAEGLNNDGECLISARTKK